MSGRSRGLESPFDLRPFPSAGVSLQNVDGGRLEQVVVTGIRMVNVRAPIFVRLGERGRGQTVPAAGTLARITISDIVATGAEWASSIMGVPGHDVSDIALSDIRISGKGRGKAALVIGPGAGTETGISRRRAIPQSSRPRPVLPTRGGAARRADHAHGGRPRCPPGPDPGRRAWERPSRRWRQRRRLTPDPSPGSAPHRIASSAGIRAPDGPDSDPAQWRGDGEGSRGGGRHRPG